MNKEELLAKYKCKGLVEDPDWINQEEWIAEVYSLLTEEYNFAIESWEHLEDYIKVNFLDGEEKLYTVLLDRDVDALRLYDYEESSLTQENKMKTYYFVHAYDHVGIECSNRYSVEFGSEVTLFKEICTAKDVEEFEQHIRKIRHISCRDFKALISWQEIKGDR